MVVEHDAYRRKIDSTEPLELFQEQHNVYLEGVKLVHYCILWQSFKASFYARDLLFHGNRKCRRFKFDTWI